MITTIQEVENKNLSFSNMLRGLMVLLIMMFSVHAFSQGDGIPERPNPPRLVNNLSTQEPILSPQEEQQLEQKLEDFANKTSNQIVIVIVDELNGLEPYDFATRLGHKWGVGQAKFDNGIVILIKPRTTDQGKRQLTIAVGYGLEGAIPDLTTKQIRENEMNPYFMQNDFFTGLDKGTDVLMSLAVGEYNSDAYGKKKKKKDFPAGVLIPIIIIILFIIMKNRRGGRGGGMTMSSAGWILGSILSNSGRSGGSFGGGGGSSGGFGGFGGGGFGGGGSSGSW